MSAHIVHIRNSTHETWNIQMGPGHTKVVVVYDPDTDTGFCFQHLVEFDSKTKILEHMQSVEHAATSIEGAHFIETAV